MIDFSALADRIKSAGLMNKSFFECTKSEIELICSAVMTSLDSSVVPPDGWDSPRIDELGKLHIGFNSHPKYHWWTPDGQSILETLLELNAPWEVAQKHIHPKYMTEADYLNRLIPF